ncbi:hypothetical protein M885DRAFT_529249 [Pelagophyceae sp. CCMP2097]|nr:hypothetical protein M885DRAFT_529249 [Pelagophyceae sp. CCMP2097]
MLRLLACASLVSARQSRDENCSESMFAVHWTHVPKAGGTAMASLARRVACAKNPHLRTWTHRGVEQTLNPCCVADLCVSEISCHASSSTCPFVQGIGRHESAMAQVIDMPCCSREWFAKTYKPHFMSALRPALTPAEMVQYGIKRNARGRAVAVKKGHPTASTMAQLAKLRSYDTWPLESRVAFFARVGVGLEVIEARLTFKAVANIPSLMAIAAREARPLAAYRGALSTADCHRAAHSIHQGAVSEQLTAFVKPPPALLQDANRQRPCCGGHKPGANSMTLLRNPFTRAASAFFYRAHSPNSDGFNVRRGVFTGVGEKRQPWHRYWSFRDFVGLDEYRNLAVKMFGDSHGCAKARKCQGRSTCVVLTSCHGYRNASDHLDESHVDAAFGALKRHAFFGVLDAYNASVLLALFAFGIKPDEKRDFEQTRPSTSLSRDCSGASALRLSASACRGAFVANRLDFMLFERVHREFCGRLGAAGLLGDWRVQKDLGRSRLCGATKFDDEDDTCAHLETLRNVEKLAALHDKCGKDKPWAWGFEAEDATRR